MKTKPTDIALLHQAFETRSDPLARDVVRSSDVATWLSQQLRGQISANRVGRILANPPINGVTRTIMTPTHGWTRVMILRGSHWLSASAKDIFEYLSNRDPMCD